MTEQNNENPPKSAGRAVTPAPSGSYETDCTAGRKYAEQVTDEIRAAGNPALLGFHVELMVSLGGAPGSGVFAGFFSRLAESLL